MTAGLFTYTGFFMSEIRILIANYHPHNGVNCRRNLHYHAGANDSFVWVVIEMAGGLRFKVALDILHPCACASAIPHEIQVPRYITFTLPGYNAKIFQHKPWRPKVFFIWNNVLVNCFCFIWIPMLWVYGHKCLISFSAGIDFRRHNLTLTCDASTIACGLCLCLRPNVISVLYQHLILLMLQNQVTSKQKHSGRKRHNLWKLKRDIISFLCDLDARPRHTVVRPRHTVVRPRHTVVRPRHTERWCGEDERPCGEDERLCGEDERLCGEGERRYGEDERRCGEDERPCGEDERLARTNDCVARAYI